MSDQAAGQSNGDFQQSKSAQPNGNSQSTGNNNSPQTMAPDELAEILLPGAKTFKGQNGSGD
ncbi:hypothetical protein Q8G41_28470, partial [Klebsiella pneumoniae]|uniref:hypothetical protein n=1 Tax=Klebsiella pneumoniae TaxID=573 RepID=UPI003013EE34